MIKRTNALKEAFQWIGTFGVAIILTFGIRNYVFAQTSVDGPSMMPTLKDKDKTFVEKLSLINESFKRSEIVIFDSGNAKHDLYVKRIIGLPGDEIEINAGKVYVNGNELDESYLSKDTVTNGGTFLKENQKYKVESGHVFVLGDNRVVSNDSRYFGAVSMKAIQGHVIFRAFPFDQVKVF